MAHDLDQYSLYSVICKLAPWQDCMMQDPAKASEAVVKGTSISGSLTAAQVSISIAIVTNLTNEVLNNSQVNRHLC